MAWRVLLAMLAIVAAPASAQMSPASDLPFPRAVELFERDWVLMDWALKRFDANRDGILSSAEAQPAARAFKQMADGDRDGRVTTYVSAGARVHSCPLLSVGQADRDNLDLKAASP